MSSYNAGQFIFRMPLRLRRVYHSALNYNKNLTVKVGWGVNRSVPPLPITQSGFQVIGKFRAGRHFVTAAGDRPMDSGATIEAYGGYAA